MATNDPLHFPRADIAGRILLSFNEKLIWPTAVRRLEGPPVGLVGRTGFGEIIVEDALLKTWIDEHLQG